MKPETLELKDRGICTIQHLESSLKFVTYCVYFNKEGCPRDCALYSTIEKEVLKNNE